MNPFYSSFQKNSQMQMSGFNLQSALQNLARQIMPTGMTPEQIVRQKIQNREMSMEQFQQYSAIADQLMGRK
jgi:hypothetical protein